MNIDSAYRAFDLDLTEDPEPQGELRNTDVETTLQQALAQRPEFEAVRQALANDDTSIRLAHNNMLPDLRLSGAYSSNGTGGNQYDITVTPPALVSLGGLGQSFSQVFGFGFPTYGVTLALNFPLRNRGAEADLGNALVSRKSDLYKDRSLREQITLEVGNAVHALEQAKLSLAASKLALDLAQKNLAAEQRKYELGSSTIFFVLDAQSQVAQAQARVLQAEVGYQVSLAQIDHAGGQLLSQFNILLTELSK
jgi:outer membrane protein TolC